MLLVFYVRSQVRRKFIPSVLRVLKRNRLAFLLKSGSTQMLCDTSQLCGAQVLQHLVFMTAYEG
jgi:hypothetical protein